MPRPDVLEVQDQALTALSRAENQASLDAWRVEFLGRKGRLTSLLRGLAELPAEQRKVVGAEANALKDRLQAAYEARDAELRQAALASSIDAGRLDVTLPGRPR